MEQQDDSKGPGGTKRTARMLHESSFATSAFTSSRGQSRPPGFIASSLDYKPSATDASASSDVTTKPGRNKKDNSKKQQEQLERERQYQQQRQYRPGHPTRAQGNFGPPPHSVRSLEDLENMTEEQIYKLFMDDPELHQAFIKATAKEQKGNNVPTSAPVGAQNARSSSRRKTSSSSKSKRGRASTKNLNLEGADREVPYFQWLFLFFLIGVALYKSHKAFSSPTSKETSSTVPKNRTGKKQKKKQGGAGKKSSTKKMNVHHQLETRLPKKERNLVEKAPKTFEKISQPKRKKKKPPKAKSTTPSNDITDEENTNKPAREQNRQNEAELVSSDASAADNKLEALNADPIIQTESDLPSSVDDDEWKTVTKSSKAERRKKKPADNTPVVGRKLLEGPDVEKEVLEEAVVDSNVESDNPVEPKKESNEQLPEVSDSASKKTQNQKPAASHGEKENNNAAQSVSAENEKPPSSVQKKTAGVRVKKGKKNSEVAKQEKPEVANKGELATAIEDDAALALQLHEEEVNLARAAVANPQEEEWAEVTVKKKKANRV